MWQFSVFRALGLMIRTLPFLLFRAAVCFAIAAAVVLAAAAGAGLGQTLGGAGTSAPLWGGVAGVGLALGAVYLSRGALFHRVRAGHVALTVEALEGRPFPWARGQVARARALTDERFGGPAELGALDRLVRSVIRTATSMVDGLLEDLLPISALDRLARASGLHLRLALGRIDEVILAHAARTRSENAWEAAHDGLVLYTQNARPMLGTALWLALVGWVLAGLVAVLALPIAGAVAALLPAVPGAQIVLAASFGWAVKAALYDPFAMACMVQLHFRLTEGQEPLAEWRGRLTQVSDKFRLLGERALGWAPGTAAGA